MAFINCSLKQKNRIGLTLVIDLIREMYIIASFTIKISDKEHSIRKFFLLFL